MHKLIFLTPQTLDELKRYKDLLKTFLAFTPLRMSEKEFTEWLESFLGNITLMFYGPLPVGAFYLEWYKRSVELHGMIRPDLYWYFMPTDFALKFNQRRLIAKRLSRGVVAEATRGLFDSIFSIPEQKTIIIKIPKGNLSVKGFARINNFEQIPNLDKGREVWKLTRQRYLGGLSGQEEAKESQGAVR